jgi:hypothetical protein
VACRYICFLVAFHFDTAVRVTILCKYYYYLKNDINEIEIYRIDAIEGV